MYCAGGREAFQGLIELGFGWVRSSISRTTATGTVVGMGGLSCKFATIEDSNPPSQSSRYLSLGAKFRTSRKGPTACILHQ